MSDAEQKFREQGEKLKEEVASKKEVKENTAPLREEEMSNALVTLDTIAQNAELARMYSESAGIGSENISSGMPILKVHSTGRSTNELSDGSDPNNGWFFYKPTQKQFETVKCHVLTISKGFNTPKMGKPGETIYNHILAGVMLRDEEYAPFIVYLNSAGHRNRMYEFGKSIHQYTHLKPVAIPIFALTVKLFTVQEPYEFTGEDGKKMKGKSWVIDYEVEKNESGTPVLVGDMKEFQFLKEQSLKIIENLKTLIASKNGGVAEGQVIEGVESAGPSDAERVFVPTEDEDGIPF